ncbi:MAG TPA: hypothetical protein VL119_09455 [Acidimicrobiia bacterium]|nr:hypothetical protein [Acidimicrobiia bacterium]
MDNTLAGGTATERSNAPEPALLRRPLDNCPKCGSWQLQPVVDAQAEGVHFLCGSCSRCWLVELGYVRRVHPASCDGCPRSELCAATYAKDQLSA